MNIWIKSERRDKSELNNLLEKVKSIKDGYIIKEEIEEIKLERYLGGDIDIKDSFYSLIVFDKDTEIKITRDGKNLYFREISENESDGKEIKFHDTQERSYFLKGKYDKYSKKWWESAFSPEFDYPREEDEDIPDEARRVGLKVKIYRDEEGEVRYFRFCGYEVVKNEEQNVVGDQTESI